MMKPLLVVYLVAAVSADLQQITSCEGNLYVGDREDLCRFYQCYEDGSVTSHRCAHGTRVATWYSRTLPDGQNPCSVFQNDNPKCLRCEVDGPDIPPTPFPNHCENVVCDAGCTCENLIDMHFCSCDGVTGGGVTDETPFDFCNPDPCQNGATCNSEWDDYWCFCPPGYTGKNCEIPICQPNPCLNGGRCQTDETNYHCECVLPWRGPCCNETTGPTDPPVNITTPQTTTLTKPDSDDYTYTVTFGDASQCGGKKSIYVSSGGLFNRLNQDGTPNAANIHRVRIYTPDLSQTDSCHVDELLEVSPKSTLRYEISDNACSSTTVNGQVKSGAAIRVVERDGRPLTVTAAVCEYDGFLAIRDKDAGKVYMASPLNYGNNLVILSLAPNNQITVYIPSRLQNNELTYNLGYLQTVRVEDPDLSKAKVVGNGVFNMWSGDTISKVTDSIEYENVEQHVAVYRWGIRNQTSFAYYIVAPPKIDDRLVSNFISVESSVVTGYSFYRWNTTLSDWELVAKRFLDADSSQLMETQFDELIWRLVTDEPVQVTHETTEAFLVTSTPYITSSIARIASMELYRKSYSFRLHGAAFNAYDYHMVVLIGEVNVLNSLQIYNVEDKEYQYTLGTIGSEVFPFTTDSAGVAMGYAIVFLNGPGFWYFYGGNDVFGATYYALSASKNSDIVKGSNLAVMLGFKEFSAKENATACKPCEIEVDGRCILNIGSCSCNPCENDDDKCVSQKYPLERNCTRKKDGTGHTVSLMYMHNSDEANFNREHEIYITTGANVRQTIRVSTPFLDETDKCYLKPMEFVLEPRGQVTKRVAFTTEQRTGCNEQVDTGISSKLIRVRSVDEYDIIVYAVNREKFSTDGWLALPDVVAAKEYYALTYAPPMHASQFAIMNFKDTPTDIKIEYRDIRPVQADQYEEFTLQPGQTFQIQQFGKLHKNNAKPDFTVDNDLTGVKIMASQEVHVWSGNIRALVCEDEPTGKKECDYTGSRDHLVEQQIPLNNWGMEYIITPIVDRKIGDQIKVLAANSNTRVHVTCSGKLGEQDLTRTINAGESFEFYAYSFTPCLIQSDAKILVSQITKSRLGKPVPGSPLEEIHDPSMIFVPPIVQYTNKYRITTPKFSGGLEGEPRPYNLSMVLLAARAEDALDIHVNTANERTGLDMMSTRTGGRSKSRLMEKSELDATLRADGWWKVEGTEYWSKAQLISHGMNKIEHENQDVAFMCIYYGADDRESIGFNVNMLLTDLPDRA